MNSVYDSQYFGSELTDTDQIMDEPVEYNEFTSNLINSIFEISEDAVFGTDSKGIIRFANKNCEALFLNSKMHMHGQHYARLLCVNDSQCKTSCGKQCPVYRNINYEEQIQDHSLVVAQTNGNEIQINLGTCYFYQSDENEVCTFFTIKKTDS